jgi:hypothetical protein
MSFDNSKYDVELNGVPYRQRSYIKSESPTFIPRVGGGDQKESDFDLLRTRTLHSFSGGILQRELKDSSSVFGSEGLYPIYDDGVCYPINAVARTTGMIGKSFLTAKAQNGSYLFIFYQTYNAPTTYCKRIDINGNQVAITLPASASSSRVTWATIWNGQLWFGTNNGSTGSIYWLDIYASTTSTEITGGVTTWFEQAVVWKNQLYGTHGANSYINGALYRYTGDTATKSFVLVDRVPNFSASPAARLLVFNNRVHLARNDGLYVYDGVQLATVDDLTKQPDDYNYYLATALRGYIYFFQPDGMYRTNGSMIEKLYDISEVGRPVDMVAGRNRLWILYSNSAYLGSSRYDKSMGYNYSSASSIDGRIACFDGKSMFTYGRTQTLTKNVGLDDFSGQGEVSRIIWFSDIVYALTSADREGPGYYHYVSTNEASVSGTRAWRFITSIDDGDFPMIDKNLENLEMVFDGTITSGETITLQYRTSGFDTDSGWTTCGTFQTQAAKTHIYLTLPAGVTYRKIQFRVSGTTTAGYGIAKFIYRYYLSPDVKWQWQMTLLCYGDDQLEALQLADGTASTQTVATLRGNIYAARSSDIPVKFLDIDQLDLNGAVNAAVTTIPVNDTSLLKGSEGFIQIDDEIMRYSARTSTQLTVTRGALGTVAATHTDNAKVFPVYRVIVKQIQNERIEMVDNALDITEDKSRGADVTLILQEV